MSPLLRVLIAIGVTTGGLVVPVGPAVATSSPTGSDVTPLSETGPTAQTTPPDPPSDRIGWENGYWWNESLDVTAQDGLNRSELEPVLARTMARIERLRQLEFLRTPDVAFITRSEYRLYVNSTFNESEITDADRLHQNTKFEALFLVGEQRDYLEVAEANRGSFAAAFYTSGPIEILNLSGGSIAMIVDDGVARFNMPTLAHELVHALQDQQFGINATRARYDVKTEEDNLAYLGIVEGDASYVEGLYRASCDVDFDCLAISAPNTGRPDFADLGAVVYQLVPYRNGPTFVRSLKENRGWAAINALYGEQPIPSTEAYIHPDRYESDPPTEVTLEDRSTEEWYVPNTSGGVDYASFGEAGIFTMFWAPGTLRNLPQDYSDDASEGWDGDRLLPYARNNSVSSGETGYVWKIVWDSPEDAQEFATAYREKLDFYDARETVNAEDVYVIPESENADFGDAFALRVEGNTTVIVNAPSLAELNEIRPGTVPEDVRTPSPTPTSTATDTRTPTATETTSVTTADATTGAPEATTTTGGQPGFGLAVAVVGLLAAALLARRRR